MSLFIAAAIAFLVGLALAGLIYLVRAKIWEVRHRVAEARLADAETALAREREERRRELENLQMTFKGLSSEILKDSREEFLKQAEPKIGEHTRPLADALRRYEEAIRSIENKREEAYGSIKGLIEVLRSGQTDLTRETSSLVAALKSPAARGRWGEVTLKRVVEVAGMSQYCDFDEQAAAEGEEGRLRPDLIVRLPGQRNVVVDAKVPIDAYMRAMDTSEEETRVRHLCEHAQAVRGHMRNLGAKAYWTQFDPAPDFVVLFLPGESFFSAALEQDRSLIEDGMASRVVLATPTTLIVLLRSVAMGWQQHKLAENSLRISEAGKELFERCTSFAGHLGSLGLGLEKAIKSYNSAVGSWEHRVIPGARKLKELGASRNPDQEIPEIEPIETTTRSLAPHEK
jgi:DNA recombination protein RmuC